MKFKNYIFNNKMDEMVYPNNIGFEEMVKFYQIANSSQIKSLEKFIKKDDWDGFKKLIKKILKIELI